MRELNSSVQPAATHRLPSLIALRAFEAAARLGSFQAAAAELHVTPSAISHQIRALEGELGVPLFERLDKRVVLARGGQELFPAVREAMELLQAASLRVRRLAGERRLVLSSAPLFATRWLMPRLADCHARHPDWELHVRATLEEEDFRSGEIDLAIRWGDRDRHWPQHLAHEELLIERITAVASPDLAARLAPGSGPGALIDGAPLLASAFRDAEWQRWFDAAGCLKPAPLPSAHFASTAHMLEAAVAGMGWALVDPRFAGRELAQGLLVAPWPLAGCEGQHFHAVCPPAHTGRPGVARFVSWVRERLAAEAPATAG